MRKRPVTTAVAATVLVLTACAGPVAVPAPPVDGAARAVCDTLMPALPSRVLDGERRKSTGGPDTAAWGKPAITLRCGVRKPAGLTPASECIEVNDVGWYAQQQDDGTLYTTIGRPAYVELAVPADYAPEINALVDVAAAVSDHDPVSDPCVG